MGDVVLEVVGEFHGERSVVVGVHQAERLRPLEDPVGVLVVAELVEVIEKFGVEEGTSVEVDGADVLDLSLWSQRSS